MDLNDVDDLPEHDFSPPRRAPVSLPVIRYPSHVQHVIKRVLKAASCVEGVEVRAFGSSVNGFGDAASDVDVVLAATKAQLIDGLALSGKVDKKNLVPRVLRKLQRELQRSGFRVHELIAHAKVPILKLSLVHAGESLECDLSVNNLLPVFNTKLLKSYADIDHRVVSIVQACKAWARDWEVHGAAYGNLSSYAFTLMVIFYMQARGALPCLQKDAEKKPEWYTEGGQRYNVAMDDGRGHGPCTRVVADFADFLNFFREEFVWGEHVVSVRTGKSSTVDAYPNLKMKARSGITAAEWDYALHIEDPFDTSRNLNAVLGPGSIDRLWDAFEGTETHQIRRWRSGRMGPR